MNRPNSLCTFLPTGCQDVQVRLQMAFDPPDRLCAHSWELGQPDGASSTS